MVGVRPGILNLNGITSAAAAHNQGGRWCEGQSVSGLHFSLQGRNATYDARNRQITMADTQEQGKGKNWQKVCNLALLTMMEKFVNH